MRILDLFCGAGGASMGIHQAFPDAKIVGIDIAKQPRYPFESIQYNVTFIGKHDMTWLKSFDFIWASPPCQRYSAGAAKWGTSEQHPHFIPAVRELLFSIGKPYCIENIVPAATWLHSPIMLCGTQFDLGVFRHRLFETSFPCAEPIHFKHVGRIGDGKYQTVTGHAGGSSKRDGWKAGGVAEWRIAMDIDWMTGDELAESIPPAYSRYILEQFKNSL